MTGSSRLAASAALFSIARRTASSRLSLTVADGEAWIDAVTGCADARVGITTSRATATVAAALAAPPDRLHRHSRTRDRSSNSEYAPGGTTSGRGRTGDQPPR